MNENDIEQMMDDIKKYEQLKEKNKLNLKKNKYIIIHTENIFNYYTKNKSFVEILKKFIKTTIWMNKITMLLEDNRIIHNCKTWWDFGSFYDDNGYEYDNWTEWNICMLWGIYVHTDCWLLIKKKFKIELRHSDLPL